VPLIVPLEIVAANFYFIASKTQSRPTAIHNSDIHARVAVPRRTILALGNENILRVLVTQYVHNLKRRKFRDLF
jgi:hypothetical protein